MYCAKNVIVKEAIFIARKGCITEKCTFCIHNNDAATSALARRHGVCSINGRMRVNK